VSHQARWNAPTPLDPERHDRREFDCGNDILNEWIKRYARQSQAAWTSRVFVVTPLDEPRRIAGFYSLHLGALERPRGSVSAARRSPDPIPAVVLGRLAVDLKHTSQGLAAGLLRDALARTLVIAENAGAKILLVHAKDQDARDFYRHFDFEPSPVDDLTLMLLVQDIPLAR
jgi:GNAT superfamily N-acetyltransferase